MGNSNAKIDVITREQGSGTRNNFQKIIMNGSQVMGGAIVQSSTEAVKQAVKGNRNAIGFISLSNLDSSVKAVTVDGVTVSVQTVSDQYTNFRGHSFS